MLYFGYESPARRGRTRHQNRFNPALKRWGHTVFAADSIGAGHQIATEQRLDAIISDLKLPDGSGLDMAIDLGLPFILMSGYGNFDDAVGALRHGCVDFLTKPVKLEELGGGTSHWTPRRTRALGD